MSFLLVGQKDFEVFIGDLIVPIPQKGQDGRLSQNAVSELRSIMQDRIFSRVEETRREIANVFGEDAVGDLFPRVREYASKIAEADSMVFEQKLLTGSQVHGILFQKPSTPLSFMQYAYAVLLHRFENIRLELFSKITARIDALDAKIKKGKENLDAANREHSTLRSNGRPEITLAARRAELKRAIQCLDKKLPEYIYERTTKRKQLSSLKTFDFKKIFLDIRDRPSDEIFDVAHLLLDNFTVWLQGLHYDGIPAITIDAVLNEFMKCEVIFESRKEIEAAEPKVATKPRTRSRSMLPMASVLAGLAVLGGALSIMRKNPGQNAPRGATASLSASAKPSRIFPTETAIRADIMRIMAEHPLRIHFDLFKQGGEEKVFVRADPYPELASAPYFQHLFVGFKLWEEGDYDVILSLERQFGDDMQQGQYFSYSEFESVRHKPLVATVLYRDPSGELNNFAVGGGVVPTFSPELRILMEIHESNLPLPPNPYRDATE